MASTFGASPKWAILVAVAHSLPQQITFGEFRAFTFGSPVELAGFFGSIDGARTRWFAVRNEFMQRWDLWGRPEAWWLFEPDVPAELRTGPAAVITEADAAAWNRLDEARREYLLSIGVDPTPDRRHTPFGTD